MKAHQACKIPRAALDVSLGAARGAREGLQQRHSRAGSRTARAAGKASGFKHTPELLFPRACIKKKKKNHTRASGGKRVLNRSAFSKRGPKSPSFEANFFFFFFFLKKTQNRRRKCKIALGRHFSVAETNEGRGEWIGSLMRLCKGHLKDSETPGLAVPT